MKKIELFVSIVTIERIEIIIKLLFRRKKTMTKTLVFQHMKVTATSYLGQRTAVQHITC